METTSSILLIAILSATGTYHVGLMNPPGCFLHNDGYEQHDGDPILLTMNPRWCKAFFYCNSMAFVASLVSIILVQRSVRLEHQALKAAIILQLFGLMGTYAGVSCRDVSTSIFSVMALACGVLLYDATQLPLMLYINGRGKIKEALIDMSCECIFCFTVAGATYYRDTLSESEATFYLNSFSFLPLSIVLVILLVIPHLYKRAIQSHPLFVFILAACMCFSGRLLEYMKTSAYIMILVGYDLVFGLFSAKNADNGDKDTADVVNDMTSCPTSPETEDGSGNKWVAKDFYIVLLGALTARVTYHAGLASLFGKVWQGSGMGGNPVMHDNSRPWYFIFFYSNAFSFVASIIVVLLLLLQLLQKRCLSKVVNTVIVLDLLGLLVAHVTSSCRSFKTIGCLSSLTVTVLAYFVICMMLLFFDRKKTPAAPASAS